MAFFNYIPVFIIFVVLPLRCLALFGGSSEESSGSSSNETETDPVEKSCPAPIIGGLEWLIHVRNSDYGWRENSHRAIIALAVSNWKSSAEEQLLMEQQLAVEITKALLRNDSFPMYPNNLALYIHALIAINKNPRDFHSIDLVASLKGLMNNFRHTPHPFLLLALCNAKSLDPYHIEILEFYLRNLHNSRQDIEKKALALQAYECAGTLKHTINETLLRSNHKYLASQQYPDGSFGNVYTTAVIVQALAGVAHLSWDKEAALGYLAKQSFIEVNMVSIYMIQLALNAEKCKFIKDLHPELFMKIVEYKKHSDNFIQYSLRVGRHPEVHHTLSINVPPHSTFFEVMVLASENDYKYNFSYYIDKTKEPSVYAISKIPNDAEENLYWRLCVQKDINHNRHTSTFYTFHQSPIRLLVNKTEHYIYWYMDGECEEMNRRNV